MSGKSKYKEFLDGELETDYEEIEEATQEELREGRRGKEEYLTSSDG
ncbi:MAG: hypothetical protein ACLFQ8_03130 [Candidatus Aenigmatarchaeota archaeon]